jgi:hypothetical protein
LPALLTNLLACENIHADVQANLDQQSEECGGVSTSYFSSASRGLNSSHVAENKEVEQTGRHVYMEGAYCADTQTRGSQEELFFPSHRLS